VRRRGCGDGDRARPTGVPVKRYPKNAAENHATPPSRQSNFGTLGSNLGTSCSQGAEVRLLTWNRHFWADFDNLSPRFLSQKPNFGTLACFFVNRTGSASTPACKNVLGRANRNPPRRRDDAKELRGCSLFHRRACLLLVEVRIRRPRVSGSMTVIKF